MSPQSFDHALDAAFWWTCQTTLSATVLIALVLLLQAIFGRILPARWRYALGLLVILRLALPAAPGSPVSIFNLTNHLALALRPPEVGVPPSGGSPLVPEITTAPASIIDPSPIALSLPIANPRVAPAPRGLLPASSPEAPGATTNQARPHFSLRASTKYLWLTGSLAMLALVTRRHRQFSAQLRRWEPVREPRVLELLDGCKLMLGVKRHVIVLAADSLNTPALFGVLKPRLLIPIEMLRELDDRELHHIFLHELVHLRRGDVLINWAMIFLRALHWFNPVVWLAFRRLRADQELACDAAVLSHLESAEQLQYGNTLVKLLADFSPTAICPGAVPFLTRKQTIKRRIKLIATFKPAGRLALAASVVLLFALVCATFTRASDTPSDRTSSKRAGLGPVLVDEITDSRLAADNIAFKMAKGGTPPVADVLAAPALPSANPGDISSKKLLEQELSRLDNEIASLKGSIARDASDATQDNQQVQAAIAEAQKRILGKQMLLDKLGALSQEDLRQALPTTVPDAVLTQSLQDLNADEANLATLYPRLGSDNPEVVAAKKRVATVNSQIDQRVKGILGGLKIQIDADRAVVESLQKQLSNDTEKAKKEELLRLKESFRDAVQAPLQRISEAEHAAEAAAYELSKAKNSFPEGSPLLEAPRKRLKDAVNELAAVRAAPYAASSSSNVDNLKALKGEAAKFDEQIRNAEENFIELRKRLLPGDLDPIGSPGSISTLTREQVGADIIQNKSKVAQLQTVLSNLTVLSSEDLRQAIVTVYPDDILSALLSDLNAAKSKLAESRARVGESNPEILTVKNLIADKNVQIDGRIKGILTALGVQLDSTKAQITNLEDAFQKATAADQETAKRTAPYYEAKENLEQLKKLREVLQLRIGQEMIATTNIFFVSGQVSHPGAYLYTPPMTVVQAIILASPDSMDHPPRTVEVKRATGGKPIKVNYEKALQDPKYDLEISPGDTVNAP